MQCPKCGSKERVKSGFMNGKQRYKCNSYKCNFTQSNKRGASFHTKLRALKLYLEGTGFRAIGRIIGVHNVTVLKWIRSMVKSVKTYVQTEMPIDIRHVDFVEMDEMWHFTVKKSENYGHHNIYVSSLGRPL